MALATVDLTDATVSELEALYTRVMQRLAALRIQAEAPAKAQDELEAYNTRMAEIANQYRNARGDNATQGDFDQWVQPVGAHDAYHLHDIVSHDGKDWESLIPNNVTEPGDTNDPQNYRWWREEIPFDQVDPDAWSGAGVAYSVDDEVVFDGVTFRCVQAHTSQPGWAPVAVPALWEPQPL